MKIFYKRKAPQKQLQDVFFDSKRQTLDLRDKSWKIELSKKSFLTFFRHHAWVTLASVSIFIGVVALIWPDALFTKADTAVFYPSSCLGGWKHPELATGKPQTDEEADPEDYTNGNSAILSDASAQIFCGGFQGEIPPGTIPHIVTLSFDWTLKGAEDEGPEPILITDDNSSTTLEAVLDSTIDTSVTNVSSVPSDPPEALPEPSSGSPLSEPVIETPTESAPAEEAPISFSIFPRAYAQEVLDEVATTSAVVASSNSFLEVLYTMDGQTWTNLGEIEARDLGHTTFDLPPASYSAWTDLSKLQVQIRSKATLDNPGVVYLDALKIEVGFDAVAKEEIPEDFTAYIVSDISDTYSEVSTSVVKDNGQESLLFRGAPGSSFRFYKVDDPTFMIMTPVGKELSVMPTYFFKEGDFVLINTNEVTGCMSLTIEDCHADAGFIAETAFGITTVHKLQDTLVQ
ncbi:MAG: hypothetical protein V4465_02895 [Patescibacteria group bacterium]